MTVQRSHIIHDVRLIFVRWVVVYVFHDMLPVMGLRDFNPLD